MAKKSFVGGGFWGMLIAHAGIAFFVVGVTCVGVYEKEKDVRLVIGEGRDFGGYVWTLEEIRDEKGQNYNAVAGILLVEKDGNIITPPKTGKARLFCPSGKRHERGRYSSRLARRFICFPR